VAAAFAGGVLEVEKLLAALALEKAHEGLRGRDQNAWETWSCRGSLENRGGGQGRRGMRALLAFYKKEDCSFL
jgi:hypothetical protein